MLVINFLYYTIYRVFRLIPRKEPIDHKLACSFFSILVFTNILTILAISKVVGVNWGHASLKYYFVLIFIVVYFLFKRYYIGLKNYKGIIITNDKLYKSSKYSYMIPLIGIIYMMITFLGFISLAVFISNRAYLP